MRRSILISILLVGTLALNAKSPDVLNIRSGFVQATQEEDYRQAFYKELLTHKTQNKGFYYAYLGATKTLMAESSVAPWTKYTYFSEGTALIEKAILLEPQNAEFRYLRFLVQVNAPEFLRYGNQVEEDYSRIKAAITNSSSREIWMDYFDAFIEMHKNELHQCITKL